MSQLTKGVWGNSTKLGHGTDSRDRSLRLYEALLSIDIAFVITSIAFRSWTLFRPFAHFEVMVNQTLGLRQLDFIRGYIAIATASLLLSGLFWTGLWASSDSNLTKRFLLSLSGFVVLFAPAIFWICVYEQDGWPVGWPYRGAPFEIIAAFVCCVVFLSDRFDVPNWPIVLLIVGHYAYWYWAPSTNPAMPSYAGPVAPILGSCSAFAWTLYVNSFRRQARCRAVDGDAGLK